MRRPCRSEMCTIVGVHSHDPVEGDVMTRTPQISTKPFDGCRFAIGKEDGRSASRVRYVAFCATEMERDAMLLALDVATKGRSTFRAFDLTEEP